MTWSLRRARHSTGESADAYNNQSLQVPQGSHHPMIVVAANSTDVVKKTVPGERATTLVPGCTNASYCLRMPRTVGEATGEAEEVVSCVGCWVTLRAH